MCPVHKELELKKLEGLKKGSLNINTLNKHIDELRALMFNKLLDILAINETKHYEIDCDQLLSMPGYTSISMDRKKQDGGVCVYLRDSILFERPLGYEDENIAIVALEIQKHYSKPFFFFYFLVSTTKFDFSHCT